MPSSIRYILEKVNPPKIQIEVSHDQKKNTLIVKYSIENTTGEPILVFNVNPPFIRLKENGVITLMSLMPDIPPWTKVIAPVIPDVIKLAAGADLSETAAFDIPILDTHPYPPGPLVGKPPLPMEDGISNLLNFELGYFPEKDNNTLFKNEQSGGQLPSYYELKRQLIAVSASIAVKVPFRRAIYGNPAGW